MIHKKIHNERQLKDELDKFILEYPHMKVLLKKGEFGSALYYLEDDGIVEIQKPAYDFKDFPQLKLVDTTGAGDCFTGAFAVQMLEGAPYEQALEFANQAGFLCITKFGAGPSIPTLAEIEEVFKK